MNRATKIYTFLNLLWRDQKGQDLIEYAMLVAAVVVVIAGFLPPTIMPAISTIFDKITTTLSKA
jgi:Flp pilus assembly pilin Flp